MAVCLGVQRPLREAKQASPIAESKNAWNDTCIPPVRLVAWDLIRCRVSFNIREQPGYSLQQTVVVTRTSSGSFSYSLVLMELGNSNLISVFSFLLSCTDCIS